MQGIVALGPHRGARLRRLGDPAEEGEAPTPEGCHARANGFDLHAGVVVPAGQRDRLERVCRYALRPPVTDERLHLTTEGQGRLELRQPWRDGTTDVVFNPVELLGRPCSCHARASTCSCMTACWALGRRGGLRWFRPRHQRMVARRG